jgi:SAM-dependent methyltransferase
LEAAVQTLRATGRESSGLKLIPLVIFLSAFLLFQVQPLLSRAVLPWFGGTAGVWTVCMLFFQTGLLAGYTYAHLLIRFARPRTQTVLHLLVLGAALLSLPILPAAGWKPSGTEDPTFRLLAILAVSAGFPYFALASTSPLLQSWVSRSTEGRSPYPLFALSNLGSFAALLSYPLLEPFLPVSSQALGWSLAFGVLAVACGIVAIAAGSLPARIEQSAAAPRPPLTRYLLWLMQSAAGTIVLLEGTNYLCMLVAVVPLLWVVPLALYLLSFVLAFASDRWNDRRLWLTALFVAALTITAVQLLWPQGTLLLVIGWSALIFCACMLCHGELASSRPHPDHLTSFYLTAAGGGALGGVMVGLVATYVFSDFVDLPLGLILPLLVVALGLRERDRNGPPMARRMSAVVVALTVAALFLVPLFIRFRSGAVDRARNFFGVVSVTATSPRDPDDAVLAIYHGKTLHGSQFRSPARRMVPTEYFSSTSGAGILLRHFKAGEPRRIGILGLGAGTLAAYGRPGDSIRYYEINPQMIDFATRHFTWLGESAAEVSVATGDARIVLEREADQRFDVLISDVYSGGTIPVHLFTVEAFQTYLRHLVPDGVLVLHLSNEHLDLVPLAFAMADHFELTAALIVDPTDRGHAASPSRYALMSRDGSFLQIPPIGAAVDRTLEVKRMRPWTDAQNSLLQALTWWP